MPAGLTGSWLSPAWVQIQVWKGVFQLDWTSGHAMRLNSLTGIEGPTVSSLNCDRPLHSGLKAPELVIDARDHQAVVFSCSHLARRWAALERRSAWLVVVCTNEGVFQRNPQS